MLICDTSGLLALADSDDPRHVECLAALQRHPGPSVVSMLILPEVDHLLRRKTSGQVARRLLRTLIGEPFELAGLTRPELAAAMDVDAQYAGLELGLADASLVVLARRYDTRDLLTLDERDFRAVTPLQGGAFRLLPADA